MTPPNVPTSAYIPRKRPGAVIAVSVVQFVAGALLLISVAGLMITTKLTTLGQVLFPFYALTGALYLVLGVFLLRGARWARIVSIVLAVLNVLTWIGFAVFDTAPPATSLLINIVMLGMLNQREVAEWCYPQ